jgi:hypothetical protein
MAIRAMKGLLNVNGTEIEQHEQTRPVAVRAIQNPLQKPLISIS